ncbi:RICIN domain-containing protein [Streptomyces sp. NPDC102264]|uniref:RICIN domain-containing protein n=1 Tax=Streptomyces sp. NPDC102264 TaxID=3366149 RepID=UPI0038179AA6
MSIEEAAARMPDIPALLERCRALAALSAICPGDFVYKFDVSPDGERLSCENDCRCPGVDHGPDGTLVWAWDVDQPYEEEDIEVLLGQLPAQLLPRLAAMTRFEDRGEQWWQLSAVIWRLPGDDVWSTPQLPDGPDGPDQYDALFSLGDLLDPSPGNLFIPDHFGPEYGSFSRADAIRRVLALRPLTEEIVRAINHERSLADVAGDVAATGYRAAPSPVPLDRGIGEGEPLVVVQRYDNTSLSRFFFEPDGAGFHRILLHHSGKAVHACGTEAGAPVVQREPDGGAAQLFLLEVFRDGSWHAMPELVAPTPYPPLSWDTTPVLAAKAFRIRAKDSGLVLGLPDRLGEPVRLEEPRDDPKQAMPVAMMFGYGAWGQLPIAVRPPAAPYGPALVTD